MHRLFILPVFLLSAFILSAQENYITIGSGGGITGMATVYKITPKGKVFKGKGIEEIKYTECSTLKRSIAREQIISVSRNTRDLAPFNHPGNVYYFMKYYDKGVEQILTWGDSDHPAPDHIMKLYENINKKVSALTYKPVESR
jgi:hypothetical protein